MKKYLFFTKVGLQQNTAYAGWLWSSFFASLFQVIVTYFFWKAVYANSEQIAGMSFSTMVTYTIFAISLSAILRFRTGRDLADLIVKGDIAVEFIRPYNLLYKIMFISGGQMLTSLINDSLIIYIIGIIFLNLALPISFVSFLCFAVSLALGILLMQIIDLCFGFLSFWTTNYWGLQQFRNVIFLIFSGKLLPFDLFPGWFRLVTDFLPFKSIVYTPISIYIGMKQVDSSILLVFAQQIAWIGVLIIILKLLWNKACRRLTVFGG